MALPEDVRNAIDGWWRAKKWPPPERWTPEQIVSALQTAGYLTARRERPEPPPSASASEPAPAPAATVVPDPPEGEAETWLDGALANAPGLPTVKACLELWRESSAKVRDGEVGKPDAGRVQEILRARIAELREAVLAAFEDDDTWAVKIGALASSYEAGGAVAEVFRLLAAGHIDEDRAAQITSAITACFPDATAETAVAA